MADGWNPGGARAEAPQPPLGARTDEGWELSIRARGIGRWLSAAFLLVWLTGWAFGEAFAIAFLVRGAIAWGGHARSPLAVPDAGTIAVGAFLLVWLLLWTVGGVTALRELLRLLWGGTLVIVAPDRVIVEHRIGPFRSRQEMPRESVQRVHVLANRRTVFVESATGRIEVARATHRAEAERLAVELRRELGLDDPDRATVLALPPGWKESITAEGGVAVVPDPTVRARQARTLGVLALIVASLALLVAHQGLQDPGRLSATLLFGIVAFGFLAGTAWLARGRNEWRVERGRIVLQRRFGDGVTERFVATALELTLTTDSDGDQWFTLNAVGAPAGDTSRPPAARSILKVMNDASAPRSLGGWLAARSEIPFTDRSPSDAQAMSLDELRARLAGAGPLGALAERLIGKLVR